MKPSNPGSPDGNKLCYSLLIILCSIHVVGVELISSCEGLPDGSRYPIGPCSQYHIVCHRGEIKLKPCANGRILDADTNTCTEPSVSRFCSGEVPPSLLQPTEQSPTVGPQCGGEGPFALGNCQHQYGICYQGRQYTAVCNDGDNFDGSLRRCVNGVECNINGRSDDRDDDQSDEVESNGGIPSTLPVRPIGEFLTSKLKLH